MTTTLFGRATQTLAALTCALLFGTAALAQTAKLEKFTVAGWNKPLSEFTNLLVDEDKGFFRSRGLDLGYVPGAGGGDAIRNLLSGQADVAFTDPSSFFAALDKGEKLRAIYDIYPQNIFNVVSLKSQNITKASDLKGKKIGVYSLASATQQSSKTKPIQTAFPTPKSPPESIGAAWLRRPATATHRPQVTL